MSVEPVTRTFGLRTAVGSAQLPLDAFDDFGRLVTAMVDGGLGLEDGMFVEEGLNAVKRFYDVARQLPRVASEIGRPLPGLRERARRCAAQVAYFSVLEFKSRARARSALASAILAGPGPACMFGPGFPSASLVDLSRQALHVAGLGAPSRPRVENLLRHARNLAVEAATALHGADLDAIQASDAVAASVAADLGQVGRECLGGWLDDFLGRVSRSVSYLLGTRARQAGGSVARPLGSQGMGGLARRVLGDEVASGNPGAARSAWGRIRAWWREGREAALRGGLGALDPVDLARRAVGRARASLDWRGALRALAGGPDRCPNRPLGDSIADLEEFALSALEVEAARCLALEVATRALPIVKAAVEALRNGPSAWMRRPRFKKRAVPLGIDDGQVYDLELERGSDGRLASATVTLSLRPGHVARYDLADTGRFQAVLDSGMLPGRGVLSLRPGGKLVLAVPFAYHAGDADVQVPVPRASEVRRVASVDVGLKTLAVVSVSECERQPDGSWNRLDPDRGDDARCFVDQRQLQGSKDGWLDGDLGHGTPCNFKRRLTHLRKRARWLQAQQARYASRHPHDYRNGERYWRLHREWKAAWARVRRLHEELARQVATRIVAACQRHGATVLRFEDLSWSQHSARRDAGWYLAWWQVHWFHADVQRRAASIASRAGVHVEWCDARGTSRRCHRCGKVGERRGKVFHCTDPACPVSQLDADLNAARNIAVASLPQGPRAQGAGFRLNPAGSSG